MAKDWTPIHINLPDFGRSVIASIRDGNSYYSEILTLEKNGSWIYQSGNRLENNKTVVGWMDSPPTFIG